MIVFDVFVIVVALLRRLHDGAALTASAKLPVSLNPAATKPATVCRLRRR